MHSRTEVGPCDLNSSGGVCGLEIRLSRWPANSGMCKRDDTHNGNKNSESGACSGKPEYNEREEHDAGGLDIVIDGDTGDNERFGVKEVEIEVGHDDEYTTEECERGGEDSEGRHNEQYDEVVECIVLAIFLDAVEKLRELRLAHLRRIQKLAPRTRPRPHVAHTLLQRIQRRHQTGHPRQGRH